MSRFVLMTTPARRTGRRIRRVTKISGRVVAAPKKAIARGRWLRLTPIPTLALLALAVSRGTAQGANPQPAPAAPAGQAAPTSTAPAPAAQAAPAPAAQAAPAGPAPGTLTYSGLVDIYFAVNGRAPYPPAVLPTTDGAHISIDNVGRAFDINDRDPSFSLGEFNISRTAGKGFPLGITATLTAGDTARIVHANEPGGTGAWQTIQQLYVTYTPHVLGRDIAIDFGTFVTPFGIEVIESSSNDEYSRGFEFTYAIPLYHAGLRATIPITPKLSLLAAAVNGWNNNADDNNGKSFIGQLTWNATSTLTLVAGFMGGPEGTGAYGVIVPKNAGNINTDLGEVQATWNPTGKLKLAVVGDLARAAGDFRGNHVSGSWVAFAGYGRYQLTPRIAVAARLEQFEDIPGNGSLLGNGGLGGLRLAGGYQKLRSGTLDLEYAAFRGHLISRLEYRHDHANTAFFNTGAGGHGPDQDTITLGEVYKF